MISYRKDSKGWVDVTFEHEQDLIQASAFATVISTVNEVYEAQMHPEDFEMYKIYLREQL